MIQGSCSSGALPPVLPSIFSKILSSSCPYFSPLSFYYPLRHFTPSLTSLVHPHPFAILLVSSFLTSIELQQNILLTDGDPLLPISGPSSPSTHGKLELISPVKLNPSLLSILMSCYLLLLSPPLFLLVGVKTLNFTDVYGNGINYYLDQIQWVYVFSFLAFILVSVLPDSEMFLLSQTGNFRMNISFGMNQWRVGGLRAQPEPPPLWLQAILLHIGAAPL